MMRFAKIDPKVESKREVYRGIAKCALSRWASSLVAQDFELAEGEKATVLMAFGMLKS